MTAEFRIADGIAIITLNNPPVNGLGHATRSAIASALNAVRQDSSVRAAVVTGTGRAFSGGADISEFNTPKALAEPTLHSIIRLAEELEKPVIAAINGICMGGGLEFAMGCHYRVAVPAAPIALPEVKLGLLPGAGGTQRLPRLVGLETALDMIVTGQAVAAQELAGTLLFDEIIPDNFLEGALAFARRMADIRPLPKARSLRMDRADHAIVLQAARERVKASAGPFPAPLQCVEAVAAAVTRPFEEGLKHERELFLNLMQTTESKALRHAFFAERAAAKIADVPENTPVREITSAAVIGAGTMGCGIAMSFADAGIPVTMLDLEQETLDRGLTAIRRSYERAMKKGRLNADQLEQRMTLIHGTLAYPGITTADIVVEAVFEDFAAKEKVFRQLDAVMKTGAILATNTSTLDVNRIAACTSRPQDVIGLHFFSPANMMKLLEVIRAEHTGKEVLATAMALAKKLGKAAVVSGVCDGFIGNRMLEQYLRQATFLLEEGCLPEQVDKAIEQFGFAMGPFRMCDMAGNDIGWLIRKRRYLEKPEIGYSRLADRLCEAGRFGQKTGAGWYDYQEGDRTPYPSKLVHDMILTHSAGLNIRPRTVSNQEIVERLVYALVNEGANILQEGIAQRASDIDIVYLKGYGFPSHRGGPMFYADTVGLEKVVDAIQGYAAGRHGDAWKPAPLLIRLAQEGKRFNEARA